MGIDYRDAGVDVAAGYKAVELMKKYVKETYSDSVATDIGSFGGIYTLSEGKNPDCLVAGTDGVGTKLKYAFLSNKHDTIGIDAVAMCVNDIICLGARPLIFLDYIALGKLVPEKVAEIVKGVAQGCKQANCALIGGETAEMPGFYNDGEYDIAGFSVGIAKKNKLITGEKIKKGDVLIGLESSGIHSNGYSLVRKLFGYDLNELQKFDKNLNKTYLDALLTPTRIYVKPILKLIEMFKIKGIAHITGGGFIENIPRMLPKGLGAKINTKSYEIPYLFRLIQEKAKINDQKMYNTFNMGIGLVLAVSKKDADNVVIALKELGETAYIIGKVIDKEGIVF